MTSGCTGVLLAAIASQRTAGDLRFGTQPGARLADWPSSRLVTAEQSNTSLIFGEAAILKVFRRLFSGTNPDLEVHSALARLGSRQSRHRLAGSRPRSTASPPCSPSCREFLAGATATAGSWPGQPA